MSSAVSLYPERIQTEFLFGRTHYLHRRDIEGLTLCPCYVHHESASTFTHVLKPDACDGAQTASSGRLSRPPRYVTPSNPFTHPCRVVCLSQGTSSSPENHLALVSRRAAPALGPSAVKHKVQGSTGRRGAIQKPIVTAARDEPLQPFASLRSWHTRRHFRRGARVDQCATTIR